jgi:hypothetical protein
VRGFYLEFAIMMIAVVLIICRYGARRLSSSQMVPAGAIQEDQ